MGLLRRSTCSLLLGMGFWSAYAQNPAVVPVPRSENWWTSRHEAILQQVQAHPQAELVFVGDSITQNYEKSGPAPDEVFAPIWQEFFAPRGALNLGYSGDQTQHVLWRITHGEVQGLAPKQVVVLIGTNNTAAMQTAHQVTEGVEAVVTALHVQLPAAKVLLVEILPSGISAEKSANDAAVNAALRSQYERSNFVRCLDLRALYVKGGVLDATLFYDPQLVPPRFPLHPNTQGQRLMARAVAEALHGGAAAK